MGASVATGSAPDYYTSQVGGGHESYYLDGATQGEPPGRWWGAGAEAFGLTGEVNAEVMHAVYGSFLDPRDSRFHDPATRHEAARLGRAPGRYRGADEILVGKVAAAAGWSDERVAELRARAEPADGQSVDAWLTGQIAGQGGLLPEQVQSLRREARGQARQAVAFVDVTLSCPKSITVLHTAYARAELDAQRTGDGQAAAEWAGKRRAVEDAIWAGNDAMLSHLNERAGFVRVGRHGAGADKWADARDWTVASFFQHTSRDMDPQIHIHNPILNRVVCPDGEVRTLDSKAIHREKQGAGSIAERVMEEHLTRTLGVEWVMRADGTGREIRGVDQAALDLFSQRSKTASRALAKRVDRFRAHFGREPNGLELDRLKRQSVMFTRRSKADTGESTEQMLDRWDEKLRTEVAGGLSRVARTVGAGQGLFSPAAEWSPSGVIAEAVAACQQTRAAWGRSELERQITLALPAHIGVQSAEQVRAVVGLLADQALADAGLVVPVTGTQPSTSLPDELRLANGGSAYTGPTSLRYASVRHVVAEQALRRAAVIRGRHAAPTADVDEWLRTTPEGQSLGADQAAAVRGLMTSGAAVSVLVGPAGTGKSHTVGALSRGWATLSGGRVVGLATSQRATEVLVEDGVDAMNTARWLGAQQRLGDGSTAPGDQVWRLTARDVVVVDEASMVDTVDLERIRGHVEQVGARMVLSGDPRQLAAVGAGGAMAMLADGLAETYTLSEVRRFTNGWERAASLRLRDGDKTVVDEYDRRGRVFDSGTADNAGLAAAAAYVGDILAGRDSLVVTPSNEMAAAVSATVRNRLVELGRVQPAAVVLGKDGNECGVGDLVQARRNDWPRGLVNRRRYVVDEIRADGSMTVRTQDSGEVRELSAGYVAEHLSLGYASTAHSAQGTTVDTAHAVVISGMDPAGLYVSLSRGRERNSAYVSTQPQVVDEPTGQTHDRERLDATTVLEDIMRRDDEQEAAVLVQQAEDARRANSLHTIGAQYEDAARRICRIRTEQWLDRLAADGVISEDERLAFATDQATDQLSRQLRAVEQAGHDPAQVLREAIDGRPLDGARSVAQVVQHRISDAHADAMRPQLAVLGDVAPADVPEPWRAHLAELADAAAGRRRELGTEVAADPPAWALDALGPVPDDLVDRAEWERRAGIVAGYRELAPHAADDVRVVGPAPGTSSPERRAAWHAAWSALGRPEAGQEEKDLGEGALRVRVAAWDRELAWAPRNVDAEMRATAQSIARHQQDAVLLRARADVIEDAAERARLTDDAAGREALAETMREIEAQLSEVAEQRAAWMVETAVTRDAADRARRELADRCRDIGGEDDRVTAAEWLELHEQAVREDDPHRPVTETDVVDEQADEPVTVDQHGTTVVDERQADTEAVAMPAGVPSPAEAEIAAEAARRAADELADRRSAEAAHRRADVDDRAAADQAAREAAWQRERTAQREATAAQDHAMQL